MSKIFDYYKEEAKREEKMEIAKTLRELGKDSSFIAQALKIDIEEINNWFNNQDLANTKN
jgi:predicted transposase YdaD